jgi:hypothetical protein
MKDPSVKQVQQNPSTSRPWKNWMIGLMTAAGFVFFARFWLLFLPVNVLGKLIPVFEAIDRLLDHLRLSGIWRMIPYLVAALLLFVITVGGSTHLYYRLASAARRSATPVMALFIVLSLFLGWLLWPTRCDTHESFHDIPNRTCNCIGLTFSFYPPFVFDASSVDYCIGWEQPVRS